MPSVATNHQTDLKRSRTVRNNVLEETALKIVEAAEVNSRLTVKNVLAIVHGLKTVEEFESRMQTYNPERRTDDPDKQIRER
jgi:predicted acyltransferase (DUF342 family)